MTVETKQMTSIDEALSHLRVDGFCVLDGVIPEDEVDAVRRSVEETVTAVGRKTMVQGAKTCKGLIAHDQSLAPYLADDRMMSIAEALLGPHVRISMTTAAINYPGNERGTWHADWPFNQTKAGHIRMPYPDAVMHLTTIWMLSPFTEESGGTFIVPGSHRCSTNPTGGNGVDPLKPYPTEMHATGEAGSVLVFDSRLWHAVAPNRSDRPRVGVPVRYAPWWLNLNVLMPGSNERTRIMDETGLGENEVGPIPPDVYATLPENVKPLLRHWVRDQ
ncbi:MAG: phytanoyl-CoA dioxygenase family protein [Phycisphaeraceae bacterium]|nr:phytanoyl-CoA dioxygenase family protein [Phycisphaeraceae bacterium]